MRGFKKTKHHYCNSVSAISEKSPIKKWDRDLHRELSAEKSKRKTLKEMFNILSHQKNTNRNNLRIHLTPVRMAKIKNTDDNLCWRGWGVKGTLSHFWWECKILQSLGKSVWWFLRKLGNNLPPDPAIPLLGIYPKDAQLCHKDMCLVMFIAALFFIVRTWKQPKCSSTEKWIGKMWYIYTVEYYTAEKIMTPWNFLANG